MIQSSISYTVKKDESKFNYVDGTSVMYLVALWSLTQCGISIVPESKNTISSGIIIRSIIACWIVGESIVLMREFITKTADKWWIPVFHIFI